MSEKTTPLPAYWYSTKIQVGMVLLVTSLTFCLYLNYGTLTLMEARNFITAREITENGNWLVPTMNGQLRLAKPPLPTWMTAWSGLVAGDMENLTALRLPAGGMAALLVLFLYLLARQLTPDKIIPVIAALVLATSFLFVTVGRQGTWDIYCHSFMVGALWLLIKGCRRAGKSYGIFILSGLLLGFSFLSKGPVSFYALLLPFVVAYSIFYGTTPFKSHWQGLLLLIVICVMVSAAWPVYVYMIEPAVLARNVSAESTAWVNRHVKAAWYYWGFPFQSGVWALFVLAALVVPYAKSRIGQFGNYRFLVGWVLITIVLLSVIPEKKERYLLPALIPQALLAAHYLRYLMASFRKQEFTRWDFRIVTFNTMVVAVAAFGLPFLLYFFAYRHQLVSGFTQLFTTIIFWILAGLLLFFFRKKRFADIFLVIVLVHVSALLTALPVYQAIIHPKAPFQSLKKIREIKAIQSLPLYALYGLPLERVWEIGKTVDTLYVKNKRVQVPAKLPAAVFSPAPLQRFSSERNIIFKEVGKYHYSRENPDEVYYLYIISNPTVRPE